MPIRKRRRKFGCRPPWRLIPQDLLEKLVHRLGVTNIALLHAKQQVKRLQQELDMRGVVLTVRIGQDFRQPGPLYDISCTFYPEGFRQHWRCNRGPAGAVDFTFAAHCTAQDLARDLEAALLDYIEKGPL